MSSSPNAGSHLLTILGEFVLPTTGSAWTGALVEALAVLGVEEKAARQAVARTARRGLLHAERVGRRTRWHLTDRARRLLKEGAARIYSSPDRPPTWDGRWVLVLTTVPESRRALRSQLRARLGWAGFAPVAPGVWLCPWVERQAEAREVLGELGLLSDARSFVGSLGAIGEAGTVVSQAWDLDGVQRQYERFVHAWVDRSPGTPEAAFRELTLLVHDWRRFPLLDPALPAELLPSGWAGARAAALFRRLHDRWQPQARDWWDSRAEGA